MDIFYSILLYRVKSDAVASVLRLYKTITITHLLSKSLLHTLFTCYVECTQTCLKELKLKKMVAMNDLCVFQLLNDMENIILV